MMRACLTGVGSVKREGGEDLETMNVDTYIGGDLPQWAVDK